MTKFNEKIGTYLHLTRKELQRLCKIHKLPANKSHYELANSLVSFFKEKNSRSPIVVERANLGSCIKIVNSDGERENAEKKHENKIPKEIDTNSTINIINENLESSDSEPNSKNQTFKSQSFTKTLDSIIPKVGLQKPVSFEYSVYSEEGINFYIDLNPNPSEWNNNFNKENPVNSISPALSENIQTENTQNPNSQIESPVRIPIEETGEENQDKNKNTNNNNINKDKNEIFEVPLKNEDSELRAHLLASCQNNEKKLKREKVIRGKIDPLTEEKSVIVLDSSGDEGDVTQEKAKNSSSELLDENQALDKNSKRQYNQDTEEFLSPNKRHQLSNETKNIEKNVNMKNTRASMQDPQLNQWLMAFVKRQ